MQVASRGQKALVGGVGGALLTLLACLLMVLPRGQAQGVPPAFHAYQIDAALEPNLRLVKGTVKIRFTNTSQAPVQELVFHLYLNAFQDRRSVFMRESRGSSRRNQLKGSGSMELSTLTIDGADVLSRARRELVPGDFTQLAVPLATPLPPGAQLQIESAFTAKLPRVFARNGYAEDFFCVAQWFPKLAKLEPNGHFASAPYHALGEFYADFADYEVTVRTPTDFVVAANGTRVRESKRAHTVSRTFVIERALDAVWIAGRSLQIREEKHAGVAITYAYAPGYELSLEEHAEVTRAGLTHFGKLFGPYPYPTLTVVVPPRRAAGAAGMEYPGLFLTAGAWLPTPRSPGLSGAFVTAHELAHQWFPMTVASDELRYPVLDEGLAQWSAIDLLRTMHGETGALSAWLPFSRFEIERMLVWSTGAAIAPGMSANEYTEREYGTSVYSAAAVALETIRRVFGRERFERALQRYAKENRFSHPTPKELADAFDHVYGKGFFARVVRPLLLTGERVGVRIVRAHSDREGAGYRTEVWARRTGEVPLPTWLAAYDHDGKVIERIAFPGEQATLHVSFDSEQEVARLALDPDRALLVDASVEDQIVEFAQAPRSSWTTRALAAAQALLSWLGP